MRKSNNKKYFYDYLEDNNEEVNYNNFITICELFDINNNQELHEFQNNNKNELNRTKNNNFKKTSNKIRLREILKEDGFIFIN